jgi:hypothetical protein
MIYLNLNRIQIVNAWLFFSVYVADENGGYESSVDNDDDVSSEEDIDARRTESDVSDPPRSLLPRIWLYHDSVFPCRKKMMSTATNHLIGCQKT